MTTRKSYYLIDNIVKKIIFFSAFPKKLITDSIPTFLQKCSLQEMWEILRQIMQL
jgi:hypothetical protein